MSTPLRTGLTLLVLTAASASAGGYDYSGYYDGTMTLLNGPKLASFTVSIRQTDRPKLGDFTAVLRGKGEKPTSTNLYGNVNTGVMIGIDPQDSLNNGEAKCRGVWRDGRSFIGSCSIKTVENGTIHNIKMEMYRR